MNDQTGEERPQPELALEDLGEGAALVAAGATLMRVENDAMLAVAIQRPRNERKVLESAIQELELYPDLAADNYYSMEFAEERGSDRKVEVAGPSIGAAMALARRWGNCVVRAFQTGEDEEKVYLSGVFLDLESNFRVERPLAVSKVFRYRTGSTSVLSDRKLIQAIQAGASKAMRNATLAGLPRGLVRTYYERTRAVAAREAKKKWSELLKAFREFGVTREILEAHLGHAIEKTTGEEITNLRGAYNALRDGIDGVTVADLFPPKEESEPEVDQTGTVESVVGAGAAVTGGAVKGAEAEEEEPLVSQAQIDALKAAAVARSEQAECTVDQLLAGLELEFGAPADLLQKQFSEVLLYITQYTPPINEDDSAPPEKPTGPPNEEVSKGGETRPKKDVGF